ncbi:flagellar hook-length control protein FliK [Polaromonas sp. YR568]|uniref:flagellar hook-length control protein FliK n=1 Tax=Polaromonas sp. YR568 TaxID=1855301 RepID=UPI00398BF3F4
MSAVTPLVDTLLATRLGQRVDLVPLKAQVAITGPGAVSDVEQVENDVRLPSREALQRQLGPGLVGGGGAALDFSQARAGGAVTLSAAARTVSALLKLPVGTTPAVRGLAPLLPDMRAPAVPVLAAALSRTVAESGLFYESHLQQFAAGQRTLAQLAREPQAGLASPAGKTPAPEGGLRLPAAGPAIPPLAALVLPSSDVAGAPGVPSVPLYIESAPAADLPETPDVVSKLAAPQLAGPAPAFTNLLASPGGAHSPEPAGPATSYGPTGLPDHAAPSPHDFSLQDAGAAASDAAPDGAARGGHPAATPIHPEAVSLVRQQLEMLAVPVFRWSGEGWPGIPMDWEIRQAPHENEERAGHEDGAEDGSAPTAPSAWTTRMTLKFPRLGMVDVRLGLAGAALQLRLNASQDGTVAVLKEARAELPRRFGAVGLELTDLQIGRAERTAGAAQAGESRGGSHAG